LKRRERGGDLSAAELSVGRRYILSSGHYCTFDGCLYKVLWDPYVLILSQFLWDAIERWVCIL